MNSFDVLIVGGSAAGLSCALMLGSTMGKPCAEGTEVGLITNTKSTE